MNAVQLRLKRLFDLLCASIGVLLLSPLLLLLAICVRLSSPGPIIYKSLRIGQDHKPFYMFKFRTMVNNAELMREELAKQNNLTDGLFKLKDDCRVTPLGSFLRKYSLDEFPQLFNVIAGNMSLVGPRPYVPEESQLFTYPYTIRFKVLPGMTGPWQISGRSNLTFSEVCNLELGYVLHWNFLKDILILFNTVPAVLLKRGAY
jgi:lipopolysaccharide/colanic/teichoic acid biosynthesis glycosyltransferase